MEWNKLYPSANKLFVEKKSLDSLFTKIIGDDKLIRLPGSQDSKYNYWPITKHFGHWNVEGHKLVSEYLTNSIILK